MKFNLQIKRILKINSSPHFNFSKFFSGNDYEYDDINKLFFLIEKNIYGNREKHNMQGGNYKSNNQKL